MVAENDFLIPEWPETLQQVDVARVRFALRFVAPELLQPADFLGLGRALRLAGRQWLDAHDVVANQQWRNFFQPTVSDDPIARRKFQKPAPPFVVFMPILQEKQLDAGGQLDLEVLFLGTGIPLIHAFLRSLIHLGQLGLVGGEARFEVTAVYSMGAECVEEQVWQQHEPLNSFACSVHPLPWLLPDPEITDSVTIKFMTPTRLIVTGKPIRKPKFPQVFPFMLRRVTSMLYAHCGLEVIEDPSPLLEKVRALQEIDARFDWYDWRPLTGRRGLAIGGFVGETTLSGHELEDVYWILAIASLLGVGKGATYGAGCFRLDI